MAPQDEHDWRPLPSAVRRQAAHVLTPKGRRKTGLFLIEGFRLLKSALDHRWPIESIIVREDRASPARLGSLLTEFPSAVEHVYTAAPKIIEELTATVEPAGVIALARQKPPLKVDDRPLGRRLLVADTIRDPGNLGAILRSAAAFAIEGVYLSPGCVEPYNPKVVRAAMGALFGLSVYADVDPLDLGMKLRAAGFRVFVADPHEGIDPNGIQPTAQWALVIGGETHGYSAGWRSVGARSVRIPMSAKVESLNSAVATGILLYQLSAPRPPEKKHNPGAGGLHRDRKKGV